MPNSTDGASPRNMGTQCENTYVENQDTDVRKSGLRKYFGLGVHTSDPLLNLLKWITYFTEVGAIVVVVVLLFLYVFLPASASAVVLVFAFISLSGGAMGWCYLHVMWVKPSRHLLLGIQQLSALKFLPWMLTVFIHSCILLLLLHDKEAFKLQETITDLTFWHWLVVWTLVLTPQVVVLAAVIRVRRFDQNLNSLQFYSNVASASG